MLEACRFLLLTCHDSLGGNRGFDLSRPHKLLICCFLWRTALWGLLESPSCSPPAQLLIFCSIADGEQLIHVTMNACGGMIRFMTTSPTPHPPLLFLSPLFPKLEGQKFKSCFEQLLTCYQLLHIACAGCILTISLEMSLLKWLLRVSMYKNILRRASFELPFLYWYIGLAKLFLSSPATDEKWLLLILFNDWIH